MALMNYKIICFSRKYFPTTRAASERQIPSGMRSLRLGFCQTARGTVLKNCEFTKGAFVCTKAFFIQKAETRRMFIYLHPPGWRGFFH